jgi:uncharacterized membrane protein
MVNALINYFMFAGQVVFCIIYFLFRLSSKSFRITLKKFFGLAFESVIGLLMAMFIFLPAAAALMGNSRIESSYTGTISKAIEYALDGKWENAKSQFMRLLRWQNSGEFYWQRYGQIFESYFFPPDIPSRVNFFSGHETRWASISMYLPMFALSGVFALFTVKKRTWLKTLIIFLIICSFIPILNSMFFLFNSSYYARWLYMMIMMLSLATIIALEDKRTKWRVPTALMTFFCTVVAIPLGLIWHENDADTEMHIRRAVEPMLQAGADKIVLGCTHYPFLAKQISKVIGERNVELINPAPAVARRAAWLLEQHNIAAPAGHKPEYSFVTFADDAYLARITDKAMMLAEEE